MAAKDPLQYITAEVMMKVLIGGDEVMVDASGKMFVFSQLAWSYLGESETEGRHKGDI